MNEEIFEVINRIQTDLNEYKEITLSHYQNKKSSKRILNKINKMPMNKSIITRKLSKRLAVASISFILVVVSATTVAFASDGKVINYLYTFFNGSGITVNYDESTGEHSVSVSMNSIQTPPVELKDGKLYFTADGGKTDITNLISDTEPYVTECVDEHNVTHLFIIGGKPIADSFGYVENLYNSNGLFLGSSGYYGKHVEGIGGGAEPEWLVKGRQSVGRDVE